MVNCCTLNFIRHSPKTEHAPWTNRLIEVQKKPGTRLRNFLLDTPENWSLQALFFAYADSVQSLSLLHFSPYEVIFRMQTRIPLKFEINLSRNSFRECTAHFCSELPPFSHYQLFDSNSLFHSIMLELICTSFLSSETAMLQIFSKLYHYTMKKKQNPVQLQCKIHLI